MEMFFGNGFALVAEEGIRTIAQHFSDFGNHRQFP
jgi:hypothetical protein